MTVCLLLAAGSSSRMSQPKMLLTFNGKSFLQHAIDEIGKVKDVKLVVVTGSYHTLLKEILSPRQITVTENKNWEQGMGSSIQAGISYVIDNYIEAENVILLVSDQPHISSSLLEELITTKTQSGKGIVAAGYDNTIGTPILFGKKYFEELTLLQGATGAKKIAKTNMDDIAVVPFPLGAIDIDTAQDYEDLLQQHQR